MKFDFAAQSLVKVAVALLQTKPPRFSARIDIGVAMCGALLCWSVAMPCQAEVVNGYSFTLMYEKPGFPQRLLGRPSINSSGAVAFIDRGFGIRTADGEASKLIATTDEFCCFGNSAIVNDRSDVAFYAKPLTCDVEPCGGIFVRDGKRERVIVEPSNHVEGFGSVVDPILNNRGTVIYGAAQRYVVIVDKEDSVFVGPFATLEAQVGPTMAVSASGRLVFPAWARYPQELAVYLYEKGELTSIATFDGSDGTLIKSVDVNNAGNVLFCTDSNRGGLGQAEVYLWNKGSLELLADGVSSCGAVAINSGGYIVLSSSNGLASEVVSLDNGHLNRILGPGDLLFGRTVRSVEFAESGSGLNDAGQLAMSVSFTNGTLAVVRAESP